MADWTCDRCGRALLADEDVRYKLEVRLYAAYDPLELSREAASGKDCGEEIRRLIEIIERRTEQEMMDEVYRDFSFDLCMRCQREVLSCPLPPRDETYPGTLTTSGSPAIDG